MKIIVISNSQESAAIFASRFGDDFEYETFTSYTTSEISDIEPLFAKSDIYDQPRDPNSIMARAKTHLKIWDSIKTGTETVVVLEDDVQYYSEEAKATFQNFLQIAEASFWTAREVDLDLDVDVFILDGEEGKTYLNIGGVNVHPGKAYAMSPAAAIKITDKIANEGFTSSVGWELLESPHLKMLAYEKAVFATTRIASRTDEHPITKWGEEKAYHYDNSNKYLVFPKGWAESKGWLDRSR
jgi:hypothetical protein